MESIIHDGKTCYLCGADGFRDPLDWHHVFGGANRKWSEKYGLKVRLCHSRCHIFGKNAVHNNKSVSDRVKDKAQRKFEEKYSHAAFIEIFGKNYLLDDTPHNGSTLPWVI